MLENSFIIGYIILVLLIGYFSSRKQTGADFMIADRKLGLFSFVSTIVASMVGGAFLVVYTAYIYEFGIGALFGIIGLSLSYLIFASSGKKLRAWAHEHEFHTIADFFYYHFGKKVRHVIAVVIASILILITLRQFIAGSQIISAISNYSYESALLISVGVVLIYLVMGGFRSVVKTDIFQYLILFFLVFAVGFLAIREAELPFMAITENDLPVSTAISFLIYGLMIVWPASDIWQRVYAAKNDDVIRKGFIISSILLFLIGLGISMIALSARAKFPDIDPAQSLIYGILHLMPPGFLSLGVILLFAALMSSADTIIFVFATNITKDFIAPLKGRRLTNDELMRYTRICLVALVVACAVFAYFFRDIVDNTLIAGGVEMSIVPVIISSFKWKLKKSAVLISIFSGLIYMISWIVAGKILPETMLSTIFVSAIILFVSQKLLKK